MRRVTEENLAKEESRKLTPAPPSELALRIETLRAELEGASPSEALDRVLAALDVAAIACRWPDPVQREANLDALRAMAAAYEERCRQECAAASVAGMLVFSTKLRRRWSCATKSARSTISTRARATSASPCSPTIGRRGSSGPSSSSRAWTRGRSERRSTSRRSPSILRSIHAIRSADAGFVTGRGLTGRRRRRRSPMWQTRPAWGSPSRSARTRSACGSFTWGSRARGITSSWRCARTARASERPSGSTPCVTTRRSRSWTSQTGRTRRKMRASGCAA